MLDARIPLGVRPMQIEPRSNMLMRAAQLQGQQDQNALRQMQMAQIKAQAEEALRARAAQEAQKAAMQAELEKLMPTRPIDANRVSGVVGPRPEAASVIGQRQVVDPIALLRTGFDPKMVEFIVNSPNLGRAEVARVIDAAGPDGRPQSVQLDKFGRPVGDALPQPVKLNMVNAGGTINPVNPYTQKDSIKVTMDPAQRDASARGWQGLKLTERGQNMTDARARDLAVLKARELEQNASAKADAAKNKEVDGKRVVDEVVASLQAQYDFLDQNNGITNPDESPLSNLVAGVSSSGIGQATGRMFGTQNQSARNTIMQQRPALMQAIMRATGMSAKQLDSNAELKLMLSTATDPELDIAANRRALDMILRLYGTGSVAPNAGDTTGEPKRISSDAEYEALSSGATFIAPDGSTRRKP